MSQSSLSKNIILKVWNETIKLHLLNITATEVEEKWNGVGIKYVGNNYSLRNSAFKCKLMEDFLIKVPYSLKVNHCT